MSRDPLKFGITTGEAVFHFSAGAAEASGLIPATLLDYYFEEENW
jgi:hypothetical protein